MQINGKEVTLDDLQNGYRIYQSADGFRFGADAVLLSDFIRVRPQETVLDLGTGSGILPILLAAKTKGKHFTGLEIQAESAALAEQSVEYNRLTDRIRIVTGDLCRASEYFGEASFSVCVSNPPYMIARHGLPNETEARYIARHEALCTFEDVAREASRVLKAKGRFYLVHRPFRLAELITTLKKFRLEPKRLQFVHPGADKEPVMIMMEALKDARSGLRVEAPVILQSQPPCGF